MEFLFIKKIINKNLFDLSNEVNYKDIFNYYPTKEELISFNNKDDSNDYEFILDIDNSPLNTEEEKQMIDYISCIKDEINKIKKVIEYLIVNIDLNKIKLLNYKKYDYDNTSKFIKSKIRSNNHNFDIKNFINKNKINKDDIIVKMKEMCLIIDDNLNDTKLVINYILIKIIEFYNIYNKSLNYSLKLLEEYPYIFKNKNEYLSIIDNKFLNITNDEINIFHHKLIKNTYSTNNKYAESINIKKNKDKNFEISFK